MNNNETALEMCLRMLKERAKYWTKNCDDEYEEGISVGYETAASMLEYAMQDNIDCLRQFDYYHKEETEE